MRDDLKREIRSIRLGLLLQFAAVEHWQAV